MFKIYVYRLFSLLLLLTTVSCSSKEDYLNKGDSFYNDQNYSKAIDYYEKALKIEPEFSTYMKIGHSYGQIRFLVGWAEKYYKKAIEIEPNSSEAHFFLGYSQRNVHNEEPIQEYLKSIELDPNCTNTYRYFGELYYASQNYDLAIKYWEKALELYPDFKEIFCSLAMSYDEENDPEKAIEFYKKSIQVNDDSLLVNYPLWLWSNDKLHCSIGDNYQKLNMKENALSHYRKSIEINPNNSSAFFEIGSIYTDDKNYDKGLEYFEKAINANENFKEAYYNLGFICSKMQNNGKAIEYLQDAVRINPDYADAYVFLGNLYSIEGKENSSADCYYQAGLVYVKENNRQKALEMVDNIENYTKNYELLVKLKNVIYE